MLDRIDDFIGDLAELTFNVLAIGVMGISGKAVYEGVKEKSWTDLPTTALPFLVSAWWVSSQPWHSTTPIEIVNGFKADVENIVSDDEDDWDDEDQCDSCGDCWDWGNFCDDCDDCPDCCECDEEDDDEGDEDEN
ncbi:MAG: hypothetical protein CL398_00255 [Acidiferrobacteraceae bacterium]|nr:hypothetical protein [Acidiferrobacteraceae bacterium]